MRFKLFMPGVLTLSLVSGGLPSPSWAARQRPAAPPSKRVKPPRSGARLTAPKSLPAPAQAAIAAVSADSLRGHVSFLASDLLEGRGTPSRGQAVAAEYIAAQFRRAGLKPAGTDGYFQPADREASFQRLFGKDTYPPRNVAGVLEGSDPRLKETYVIVSAHYDHLGVKPGEGDSIFNGANDNASGVAALIELASVLSALKERPRRSLLFLTYFGEELGMFGSRYYARNPLVPTERTVTQINLEQLGRTDSPEGPRGGAANLTGFDYSTVGETLVKAGALAGVRVSKDLQASDAYFPRSDNIALAQLGVPAHTLSVVYSYPDYHGAGDHWEKLDYANLKRVTGMIAAGLLMIANDPQPPRWREDNPLAAPFAAARQISR